ncbi:hypothetical protein MLD38_026620 [Melastoma candidum]|uniref:Uncharacterized protein n=1 Tax=Melastoma candidum TaxID=119954 RepID=A0ACB9NZ64_9MYRT|nr:hypothetical protein MLD38_026620 [Melastoma candidum]
MTMRSIRTCYNEHAIRVSDSYCSGPGPSNGSFMSPSSSFPSMPVSVSSVYKSKPSSLAKQFLVTVAWHNNLLGQGFVVNVAEIELKSPDVSVKPVSGDWQLRKRKGSKTFQYCDSKFEVSWDLTSARFSHGPEPDEGFYVLVFADSEVVLLLGDMEADPEVKRALTGGPMADANFSLVCRNENFSGTGDVYSSRARFSCTGTDHEIMIRCIDGSSKEAGPCRRSPALSVSVDDKPVFQVRRLLWNFRGNQTIFVDWGAGRHDVGRARLVLQPDARVRGVHVQDEERPRQQVVAGGELGTENDNRGGQGGVLLVDLCL